LLRVTNYKTIARPATARAPIPDPTLAPLLAWTGPVVDAVAVWVLPAADGAVVVPTTGTVGVGGLPATVVAIGMVVVPDDKL